MQRGEEVLHRYDDTRALWRLRGNANDELGNFGGSTTGTPEPSYDVRGEVITFTSGEYFTFAEAMSGVRTIDVIVKPTNTLTGSSGNKIVLYRAISGGSNDGGLVFVNNQIGFQRKIGATDYTIFGDGTTWTGGVWHHLVAVIDPTTGMALYVDGVKQADTDASTSAFSSNSANLFMAGSTGGSSDLVGTIMEARVDTGARTETEIQREFYDIQHLFN